MFWFQHPEVLVKNFDLWPLAHMSFNNKLNAISRLVILLSVIGFAYTKNTRILIAGVTTLGVIIFLHQQRKQLMDNEKREGFTLQDLVPNQYYNSNSKNPLGNVLLPEIQDDPKRPEAPPAFSTPTHKEINENTQKMVQEQHPDFPDMDKRLFKDLGDSFEFQNSMIPFNSCPNTQVPNDQNAFAKFCYGDMPSCKAGDNIACLQANGAYLQPN